MNNFELISHATTLLKEPSFHPQIALIIHQMISSKRRAVPKSINPNSHIHLTRTIPVKCSDLAIYLESTYGKGQYFHYSSCVVQSVLFKVHSPKNKQVDDCAVLYVNECQNLRLGIIIGIIKLKLTGEILFIVDEAIVSGYDSFDLDRQAYKNEFCIFAKLAKPRQIISIRYNSIKEKVAYRFDENLNYICEFYLFPNRLEST